MCRVKVLDRVWLGETQNQDQEVAAKCAHLAFVSCLGRQQAWVEIDGIQVWGNGGKYLHPGCRSSREGALAGINGVAHDIDDVMHVKVDDKPGCCGGDEGRQQAALAN